MYELNREHRGVDKTTDVLSFPIADFPHAPFGSIVITSELASQKALEFGHTCEEEITLTYPWSFAPFEAVIMRSIREKCEKEEALIHHYHLPQPYCSNYLICLIS